MSVNNLSSALLAHTWETLNNIDELYKAASSFEEIEAVKELLFLEVSCKSAEAQKQSLPTTTAALNGL